MKIICVGRNYAAHAKELNNEVPDEPVFFLKPDTALLRKKEPFYYPDFSTRIEYEAEIVVKIGKQGKNIDPAFAERYIHQYTIGIDFTARDLQHKLKSKGLPWEKAKAFDRSAATGKWLDYNKATGKDIAFTLDLNGKTVQQGITSDMLFPFTDIIAHASKFFTLKTGDLIYTGTPEGVGEVKTGDKLTGKINGEHLLDVNVK